MFEPLHPRLMLNPAVEIRAAEVGDGESLPDVGHLSSRSPPQRMLQDFIGSGPRVAKLRIGLRIRCREAGATQRIVKMVKADPSPAFVEFWSRGFG